MTPKLGLTGGIGSGKSLVSAELERLGANIIDADIIARQIVEPGSPNLIQIRERYGNKILEQNGSLNRKRLREIVFHSPEEKAWLETLLHPEIRKRIILALSLPTQSYHVLVSPLLFETQQNLLVDKVIVVDAQESQQIQRTVERDESSEATVQSIINSQQARGARLDKANYVIDNSGSIEETLASVRKLHSHLTGDNDDIG